MRFTWFAENIYNLGFGDVDLITREIDDMAVTNNEDSRKVLATIARIVHDFLIKHKGMAVIATGNTSSRNRLYRIGITINWDAITTEFEVFGLKNWKWEPFEREKIMTAFW